MNGRKTVLLVEPQTKLRAVLRFALARLEYRVLEAANARDASALIDLFGGPVHVVVTELVLPDLDGLRLCHAIAARRPAVASILMSSDCDDVVCLHPAMMNRVLLLRKPFRVGRLIEMVRQLSNGASASVRWRTASEMTRRRPRSLPPLLRIAGRHARVLRRTHTLTDSISGAISVWGRLAGKSLALWGAIVAVNR